MPPLNIISLGAGVQSSALAMMAEHRLISPCPDAAIFADTGAEPDQVYEQVQRLNARVGFPIYAVRKDAGLLNHIIDSATDGRRYAGPPLFADSESRNGGHLRRFCAREFKIQPIEKIVRELAGLKAGEHYNGVDDTPYATNNRFMET